MQDMSATPLQVYEAIKPKLGEREAQLLLEHIARQTELFTRELATKSDIKDMATKADMAVLREQMATKADMAVLREQMATRADLKDMATKSDIKDMATKADIKDMATKADIKDMATREDMAKLREEMAKLESRLIRWNVGTIIAVTGLTLAVVKLIG